jgi:hypothetical protein
VIEIYPAVELTYLTSSDGATQPDALTFVDPPLPVILGDRTQATIQYTVRFKVTSEGLPIIHTRSGNAGIKGILRDESRRVLLAAFSEESVVRGAAVGPAVAALEARVSERMEQRLGECGFAMSMFNLRGVDFAETGEVIQSALRAREELERERAVGAVRLLRAEQEAQINAKLAGSVSAPTLEYLRIQAMRELIERWDGKFLTPPGSVSLLSDEAPTPRPPQPSEPEQPAT